MSLELHRLEAVQLIPMRDAQVCLDCECISTVVMVCPACGSKVLWRLDAWLARVSNGEAT